MSNVDWASLVEAERLVADRMNEQIKSHPLANDVPDLRIIVRDVADRRRAIFAEMTAE